MHLFKLINRERLDKIKYSVDKSIVDIDKIEKQNILIKSLKYQMSLEHITVKNKYPIIFHYSITNIHFKIFGFDLDRSGFLRAIDINNKNDYFITDRHQKKLYYMKDTKSIQKYDTLIQNMVCTSLQEILKPLTNCQRLKYLRNYYLYTIYYMFDLLNTNGCLYIYIPSYCISLGIEIIYILSYMFKEILILDGNIIYAYNFLGINSSINQKNIDKLIKSKKPFSIYPKPDLNKLIKYINEYYKRTIKNFKILYKSNINEYIKLNINNIINFYEYLQISNFNNIEIYQLIVDNFINYSNYIKHKHTDQIINYDEGKYIMNILNKNNINKCLEIGLMLGINAYYILSSKKSIKLVSIDDTEKTVWNNIGIKLIKYFKLNKRHKLIKDEYYNTITKYIKKKVYFDFILLNGMNNNNTNIISYFSLVDKILNINGILIIGNVIDRNIRFSIEYFDEKYKNYEKIDCPVIRLACYKKIYN
jgi:predicted O-methyltransferase YrrM